MLPSDNTPKNMITTENINKAIDYINKYVQDPLKNDEVLEKTIYYSLYLKILGPKDNDITKLGTHMLAYLKNFDKEEKDQALKIANNELKESIKDIQSDNNVKFEVVMKILKILNTITQKQSTKVNEFYNEITRNE